MYVYVHIITHTHMASILKITPTPQTPNPKHCTSSLNY